MGFIIHKYLSKSLKTPAPSSSSSEPPRTVTATPPPPSDVVPKPKKGRKSDVVAMYLPPMDEDEYMDYSPPKPINRRGSMGSVPTSQPRSRSGKHRRATLQHVQMKSDSEDDDQAYYNQLYGDDNEGYNKEYTALSSRPTKMPSNMVRRASLTYDTSAYYAAQTPSYNEPPVEANDSYYAPPPPPPSTPSFEDTWNSGYSSARVRGRGSMGTASSGGSSVGDDSGNRAYRSDAVSNLQSEIKWLQVQLKDLRARNRRMEWKLTGTRDQMAYQTASWIDQLHAAQSHHASEIFQTQRAAEKAANAVLEAELEEWRSTLHQVVEASAKNPQSTPSPAKPQEETKQQDASTHSWEMVGREVDTSGMSINKNQLYAELQEWKNRHAQATSNAARIQEILQAEAAEKDAHLAETQRRVEWLEMELKAAFPPSDGHGNDDDDDSIDDHGNDTNFGSSTVGHIALLQIHRTQLEERIQELITENSELEKNQRKSSVLEARIQELESTLVRERQEATLTHSHELRKLDKWERMATEYRERSADLEQRLAKQTRTRESIRAEYLTRLEELEAENNELKEKLQKRESQWTHERNLKQHTIDSLREEVEELMQGKSSLPKVYTMGASYDEPEESDSPESESNNELENIPAEPIQSIEEEDEDEELTDRGNPTDKGYPASPPEQNDVFTEQLQGELETARNRERELLLQIAQLTINEAKAQKQVEEAEERVRSYEKLVQKQDEEDDMDNHDVVEEDRRNNAPDVSAMTDDDDRGLNTTNDSFATASQSLHERLEQERQRLASRRTKLRSFGDKSPVEPAIPPHPSTHNY